MPLPKTGEPMYPDLRAELVRFKHASPTKKQQMLTATISSLSELGDDIASKDQAIEAYRRLAYAATLINYANALRRIETGEFFDILIDFKMVALFKTEQFAELNNYFEFHPQAPQMKLKQPLATIPPRIWHLFRDAQKEKLRLENKSDRFNLDELDIDAPPPADQLYPLPIQMLGKYQNEAVDRVWGTANGEYTFAANFGVYLLPGGGMIEIDLGKTLEKIRLKMLDEHLEEQHANLWYKAADNYNEVPQRKFIAALEHCTTGNEKIKKEYRDAIGLALDIPGTGASNAEIMAEVVVIIDRMIEKVSAEIAVEEKDDIKAAKKIEKQALNVLRATAQLDPFKLTALYGHVADYIRDHSAAVKIEQFGDTRACGGKQTSNSYLMFGNDLLDLFQEAFNGEKAEAGDDIRGSKFERMSLLNALTQFSKVKFSHMLIVLAHQVECLEKDIMRVENVWNRGQFNAAREALCKGATEAIKAVAVNPAMAALTEGQGLLADRAVRAAAAERRVGATDESHLRANAAPK